MLFADINLLDADFAIKHHQWVGVRDGRIAYIGSVPPAPDVAATFGETYDGTGRLLMPALYNAHAHAPMTLLRGYAENLPLQRWLEEKCFPFEAKMTAEDCYWGTVLACAEMARFGVVSFSDMYYATEERARAVLEAGMKANMCEGLVAFEEKPYAEYPICAQMEADIAELDDPDEKAMFMEELGLKQSGLDRLIQCSYELLGLISFLTAGSDECRAWTIKKGTKAPQAAGKIHSDFERGFIRAEVIAFDDLKACGTLANAKAKGLLRSEGKEYVMHDGDVVNFLFNV